MDYQRAVISPRDGRVPAGNDVMGSAYFFSPGTKMFSWFITVFFRPGRSAAFYIFYVRLMGDFKGEDFRIAADQPQTNGG